MIRFKLICSDIDGTLLNNLRDLSDRTKTQLRRISADFGVPIVLVSSRMPKAMTHFLEEIGLQEPLIAYNGAYVLDKNRKILVNKFTPAPIGKAVYDIARPKGLHVSMYQANEWYTETNDYWAEREIRNTKVTPDFQELIPILEYWKTQNTGAHKIMLMGDADQITQAQSELYAQFSEQLHLYRSKDTYLEINTKSVSKASAIEILRQNFQVEISEIIAFGDNWNDTEMLRYAGHGVAMENAPDEVKKCANEIAPKHTEDGVAQILEKYF